MQKDSSFRSLHNRVGFGRLILEHFALTLALSISLAAQRTILVDPLGGGEFIELQEAIDAAQSGDTIRMVNGETYFNQTNGVTIDKPLIIEGAPFIGWGGRIPPYIMCFIHSTIFTLRASSLTLKNVRLVGFIGDCAYPVGVYATRPSRLTLIDCAFDVQTRGETGVFMPASIIEGDVVSIENSTVIGGNTLSDNYIGTLPDACPAVVANTVKLKNSVVHGGNGATINFASVPFPPLPIPFGSQAAPGIRATTVHRDSASKVEGGKGGVFRVVVGYPVIPTFGPNPPRNPDAPPIEAESIIYTLFASATIEFGSGCAGSVGIPGLSPTLFVGSPRVGTTMRVFLSNLPTNIFAAPFGMIGFSRERFGSGPLPFDLGSLGMPGCNLLVDPQRFVPLLNINGSATWDITIPPDWTLAGEKFFVQAGVRDDGTNLLGLIVSNALECSIGL